MRTRETCAIDFDVYVDSQVTEGDRCSAQPKQVIHIAKVIEGLVWVFDGELSNGRVGDGAREHRAVDVRAVRGALIGWEDDKLRDALAGGELVLKTLNRGREADIVAGVEVLLGGGRCEEVSVGLGEVEVEEAVGSAIASE